MQSAASSGSSNLKEGGELGAAELAALARSQAQTIAAQDEKIAALEHQIEWFRRQIFGQKSERFAPEPDPLPRCTLARPSRCPPRPSRNSLHACGNSTSPPILCAPRSTTFQSNQVRCILTAYFRTTWSSPTLAGVPVGQPFMGPATTGLGESPSATTNEPAIKIKKRHAGSDHSHECRLHNL
jgi:hypothetical protein